ncbi:MAG: hypothetical protein KDC83_05995 [Flavobacteriales bacterium]|nr:hypothetical protein [Flavobacteriales bacterium]
MANSQSRFFLLAMLCCMSTVAFAQTTTNSPYSIYGLGDPNTRSFAQNRSMGGAQIASSNPLYINAYNPAAYGFIAQPTFNITGNIDFLKMSGPSNQVKSNNAYMNDFSFGFQLGKRAGVAFTLNQYTKIGYNIQATENNPQVGTVSYQYTGSGGINHFLFGGGIALIKKERSKLYVGINGTYYFGFAETNRYVSEFIDQPTHLNSGISNRTNINDLALDVGVLFKQNLGKGNKLGVGVMYTPQSSLKATHEQFVFSYITNSGLLRIKDSVSYSLTDDQILTPSFLGVGLSLELGSSWTLNGDIKIQDWSQLQIYGRSENLNPRIEYSFGAEYLPNPDAMAKYLQSIRYRVGARNAQTRLNINGTQLTELGGSVGVGLPILKAKSTSTLNIGMEFGQRSGKDLTLIKEGFTYVFIGVSFNPHKFDTWFKRRKYE